MNKSVVATGVGGIAILMWAFLALFKTYAYGIPPFQLLFMAFTIAFLVGFIVLLAKRRPVKSVLRQSLGAWVLGVGGLLGFHMFYFIALDNAPSVEASLIAYLWPLLIVLFSGLLPGERLHAYHVLGALMGLFGAGLLIMKKDGFDFQHTYLIGYLAALGSALTWSGYSVVNRNFGKVPTDVVTFFCALVAILGLLSHVMLESWVMPNTVQSLAILGLGLGPVGAAFYVWDYGTKHGDIRLLGALAYTAPLLSTCLLIVFAQASAEWRVVLASFMIVAGALLAGKQTLALLFHRRSGQSTQQEFMSGKSQD